MRPAILKMFGILGVVTVCFSMVTPVQPTAEAIRGIWVGFTSEANDFYRIELNDRDGSFASSFAGGEAKLYKIGTWKLDSNGQLKMALTPLSSNAYPILVYGKPTGSRIQLQVGDPAKGWTHEVVLFKEQLIEDRIELLKRSMDSKRQP